MKTQLTTAVLAALLCTQTVTAEAAPWLKVDGQANFDVTGSSSEDYERNLRVQDAEIKFELIVREGIKMVVKTELEQKLNKSTMDEDFDLGKFLEEAYIQIETDKISGLPRAVITAGKHQMAFGQNYTELPMFKDALLYNLSKQDEVIGFTVELPANFFKIVDTVAISMFEAGAGDLKVSDEKGASIKLSKELSNQLSAQISGLMKENEGTDKKEKRGSIGFVFRGLDGSWKVWAEGVVVVDHPEFTDTTVGGKIGGSYKVGPGAVVVEYQYLDKQAHEVAVAYNLPVGTWLVLSPEIRHRRDLSGNGTDETIVGIRARIKAHVEARHNLLTGKKN
ncbi:hypothetical protein QJS83_06840 [Bdellovibrio sp. 22V]|uniref:hypothetical protein n=1 Tax=Bdellovibrio TaxID=958 RepID=UPI002543628F|nr:hypothetical protein [Bdellovibrio sp. 22V]WII73587.1 hypothetical protein QJS83_06840 [Bdellovibrio sp. 22V]